MSLTIHFEDGHEKAVDKDGNESLLMEIDEEGFTLDSITDYGTYLDLKPPEKEVKQKSVKAEAAEIQTSSEATRHYKKHGSEVKSHFFHLIYVEGMTAGKAAKQLGIARRTGYDWLAKDQKEINSRFNTEVVPTEEPKKIGRPSLLNEVHQKHLEEKFADHPSATLDQAMESLTSQFSDLKVTKTTVYNFVRDKCALSLKKAHFMSKERNSPENI